MAYIWVHMPVPILPRVIYDFSFTFTYVYCTYMCLTLHDVRLKRFCRCVRGYGLKKERKGVSFLRFSLLLYVGSAPLFPIPAIVFFATRSRFFSGEKSWRRPENSSRAREARPFLSIRKWALRLVKLLGAQQRHFTTTSEVSRRRAQIYVFRSFCARFDLRTDVYRVEAKAVAWVLQKNFNKGWRFYRYVKGGLARPVLHEVKRISIWKKGTLHICAKLWGFFYFD